jgi:ribosomal protein S18 acetylase RimI-like enzyme
MFCQIDICAKPWQSSAILLCEERKDRVGVHGDFEGEERGRVHWVGIVPSYQGRKLSKPLLSAVVARLAIDHQKAYLNTQTTSYQAVNLYLNFGFMSYLGNDSGKEGWVLMEQILHRKIL